jgi:hypothetical protein
VQKVKPQPRPSNPEREKPKILKQGLPPINRIPHWPTGVIMSCAICFCQWEIQGHEDVIVFIPHDRTAAHGVEASCPICKTWTEFRYCVPNQER